MKFRQNNYFWYGHVQRTDEEKLPLKMLHWIPAGRRKRETENNTERRRTYVKAIAERGLRDGDWEDRLVGDWVSKDVAVRHGTTIHTCIHTRGEASM
jgi:hypothetical protein